MSGINRIPVGYLNLVGTETGGKTPSDAQETVSPVVDMSAFYAQQALASINFAVNNNAIGDSGTFDVPSNETWIVYSIGVNEALTAAGDSDEIALFFQRLTRSDSQGNTSLVFVAELTAQAALSTPSAFVFLPQPLMLLPGSRLITQVMDRVGTAGLRVSQFDLTIARLSA